VAQSVIGEVPRRYLFPVYPNGGHSPVERALEPRRTYRCIVRAGNTKPLRSLPSASATTRGIDTVRLLPRLGCLSPPHG
jgi:hypothetical protein